jgi:hypothetical protein
MSNRMDSPLFSNSYPNLISARSLDRAENTLHLRALSTTGRGRATIAIDVAPIASVGDAGSRARAPHSAVSGPVTDWFGIRDSVTDDIIDS